jgi:hypothetical protein
MNTFITLPEGFVSGVLGYSGDLFTDLAPYIEVILGVLLGSLVLYLIIGAIRK